VSGVFLELGDDLIAPQKHESHRESLVKQPHRVYDLSQPAVPVRYPVVQKLDLLRVHRPSGLLDKWGTIANDGQRGHSEFVLVKLRDAGVHGRPSGGYGAGE